MLDHGACDVTAGFAEMQKDSGLLGSSAPIRPATSSASFLLKNLAT
jgi:hypothetical protein